MKKNAIQTLIFLNSRQSSKLDSTNAHKAVNQLPKANHINIQQNAKQYAITELENSYGIRMPEKMSEEEVNATQRILDKIQEIKRTKSLRLAGFIERITQRMNYEQLQEARQFLHALNRKEVKELSFTLDVLQSVVRSKLQRQTEFSENHTVASAMSLIEELKGTKKMDQL